MENRFFLIFKMLKIVLKTGHLLKMVTLGIELYSITYTLLISDEFLDTVLEPIGENVDSRIDSRINSRTVVVVTGRRGYQRTGGRATWENSPAWCLKIRACEDYGGFDPSWCSRGCEG